MKTIIKDEQNNKTYKLTHVAIKEGWTRNINDDYFFEVELVFMDDTNTSGQMVSIAKLFFASENPHLGENVPRSMVSKEEALESAKGIAHTLSLKYDINVDTLGTWKH